MRIPTARMRGGSVVRSHIFCAFVFSRVNKNLTTKRKKEEKRSALSYTRVYVELEFNWTTRPKRPRYFFFL